MTYGTEQQLALDTGQTLAARPPPIHRQVDSSQEYQATGPSCHPLSVWSLARVLCLAPSPDANKAGRGWTDTNTPPTNPLPHTLSVTIWLSTLLVSAERVGGGGGNLSEQLF